MAATMERPLTQVSDPREALVGATTAAAVTGMRGAHAPRPSAALNGCAGADAAGASRYDCVFCGIAPAEAPYFGKCQHVGCYACWMEAPAGGGGGRECPACGAVVAKSELKQIVFH